LPLAITLHLHQPVAIKRSFQWQISRKSLLTSRRWQV